MEIPSSFGLAEMTTEAIAGRIEDGASATAFGAQRPAPAVQIGTLKVGDQVVTMVGMVCKVIHIGPSGLYADLEWLNEAAQDRMLWHYPVRALDRASGF